MFLSARSRADRVRAIHFFDGALTTYNNPAFQAFLIATVEPYNLNWPAGEDQILVVSMGAATNPKPMPTSNPAK